MFQFIKGGIIFLVSLILFILALGKVMNIFVNDTCYCKEAISLPKDKNIVFLGDSHAMCTFNDSIIPHSFNASRNSESYFQTYQKLKIILEANPRIRTVVLSYSPHNLSDQSNGLILYGQIYYPLLDKESKDLMRKAGKYGILPGYEVNNFSIKNKFSLIRHQLILGFISFKYGWGLPFNLDPYLDFLMTSKDNPGRLYQHPLFTLPYKSIHSNLDNETISNAITRHFGDKKNFM